MSFIHEKSMHITECDIFSSILNDGLPPWSLLHQCFISNDVSKTQKRIIYRHVFQLTSKEESLFLVMCVILIVGVIVVSLDCPVMELLQLHHFLTVWHSTICRRTSNDYDVKSTFRHWYLFLISDLLGMPLLVISEILLAQVKRTALTT